MTTDFPSPAASGSDRITVDRWLGAAFALAGFAVLTRAAFRCFGADVRALAATVPDDAFYYLLPAFRLHEHGIWTFDGEHATYGFNPLFACWLAALATLFGDRFSFLRAALWSSHLLFLLAAIALVVFVRVAARRRGPAVAALLGWSAGGLFLVNLPVLLAHTYLKENVLYALLLLVALRLAVAARDRATSPRLLLVGAVLGLSLLTRLTSASLFAAAVIGLWSLPPLSLRRTLALATGALLTMAPWYIYAWSAFHRILPTAGAMKTDWLWASWGNGTLRDHLAASAPLVPGYLTDAVASAVGQPSGLHSPQWWSEGAVAGGTAAWLVTVLLVGAVLGIGNRRHLLRCEPAPRLLLATALASLLGTATMPLLLDAGRDRSMLDYAQWYVAAEPILFAGLSALALDWCFLASPHRGVRPLIARGAALLLLALGINTALRLDLLVAFVPRADCVEQQAIVASERANRTLPADARLGAWNAGLAAFFSNHPLVNLDGLANDEAAAARLAGVSALDLVRRERVDFVLDVVPTNGWFGNNPFDHVEPIDVVPLARQRLDGYWLLRVVDLRFPDFEPLVDSPGVEVHRFVQPSPVAAATTSWRSFRLSARAGSGKPAAVVFQTSGQWRELRAVVKADSTAEVVVRGDDRELRRVAVGPQPATLAVAIHDVQVLEVIGGGNSPVWFADTTFATESQLAAPPPAPEGQYGVGFRRDGPVPRLICTAKSEAVTLRVVDVPPDVEATVLVSGRSACRLFEDAWRLLVEVPPLAILPVAHDAAGEGEVRWIPAAATSGMVYAQLFCRRRGVVIASSCGLRIRLNR